MKIAKSINSMYRGAKWMRKFLKSFSFDLERSLAHLYKMDGRDFTFIQIGANDGVTNDPIHRFVDEYRPRGILVEPQPEAYDKLKLTYPNQEFPNLELLNYALNNTGHKTTMWRIKPSFEPVYKMYYKDTANASGITSFNKTHVESFLKKVMGEYFSERSLEDAIESIEVPACTWEELIANSGFDKLTFLQVDAEGYDAEIVRLALQGPEKWLPKAMNFESKNIPPDDLEKLSRQLKESGYRLSRHGGDAFCLRV